MSFLQMNSTATSSIASYPSYLFTSFNLSLAICPSDPVGDSSRPSLSVGGEKTHK